MYFETMPLYPELRPGFDRDSCVRVPVFEAERRPGEPGDVRQCRRVTIENPCRPGERAEVLLGLDACGNLVVCVRRDRDCDDWSPRPRCDRGPRRLPEPPCPPPVPPCRPPEPCRPMPGRGCGRGRLYGTWR